MEERRGRRLTDEERQFLRASDDTLSAQQVAEEFERQFGKPVTPATVYQYWGLVKEERRRMSDGNGATDGAQQGSPEEAPIVKQFTRGRDRRSSVTWYAESYFGGDVTILVQGNPIFDPVFLRLIDGIAQIVIDYNKAKGNGA